MDGMDWVLLLVGVWGVYALLAAVTEAGDGSLRSGLRGLVPFLTLTAAAIGAMYLLH